MNEIARNEGGGSKQNDAESEDAVERGVSGEIRDDVGEETYRYWRKQAVN